MVPARVALGFLLLSGAAVSQQYVISTVAGGAPIPTPIAATSASIGRPEGVAVGLAGEVYFTGYGHSVYRIDARGVLTRVAGNGRVGFSGDGGPATSAQLFDPRGVAVDAAGNLYIADSYNNRIRKVATNGIITTVAGNGSEGYSGDGGPATSAQLYDPRGVAVDAAGNLYIADDVNQRIRRVGRNGIITTVAGNGSSGYSGDGGSATSAQLAGPSGVAVDAAGNLYIADVDNNRIRKVGTNGIITTVAGNGSEGYSGDGGLATSAQLCWSPGCGRGCRGQLVHSGLWQQSHPQGRTEPHHHHRCRKRSGVLLWRRRPSDERATERSIGRGRGCRGQLVHSGLSTTIASARSQRTASSPPLPETALRVTPATTVQRRARN